MNGLREVNIVLTMFCRICSERYIGGGWKGSCGIGKRVAKGIEEIVKGERERERERERETDREREREGG